MQGGTDDKKKNRTVCRQKEEHQGEEEGGATKGEDTKAAEESRELDRSLSVRITVGNNHKVVRLKFRF